MNLLLSLVLAMAPVAVADDTPAETTMNEAKALHMGDAWTGPYGGVPPFGTFEVADALPDITAALEAHAAELEAIATNKKKATFENTIQAMETAGGALDRATTIFYIWRANLSNDDVRAVEGDIAKALAEHSNAVWMDERLYARIDAVRSDKKFQKKGTDEQKRLVDRLHTRFTRNGAHLPDAERARLAEIHVSLADLYTKFSQRVLHDEETFIQLTDEADLAGVSDGLKASMAALAADRGVEGWVVVNTRSSAMPFLVESTRRDLREQVWRAYVSRGDHAGEYDTKPLIQQILKLRAEKAKLLGFETYAHWRLDDSMAKTPEAAMALVEAVWKPAVARVGEEVAEQQALADAEGADITIAPWDYRFYMEKVRKARYDLDANEIRPYMQLEKLREGMFWMAGELYGLSFSKVEGLPVFHPDVTVYEVKNGDDLVGLWYFDPFARAGKRSGAWMNAYRVQNGLTGEVPIVSNNSNFVKGAPGAPVLISWDDANTLFHEFGHAIHGLLSQTTYPSLAGTNVDRDYVEFPSQLHEHWLSTTELLSQFALHVDTGEPMPPELLAKIEAAATFHSGFDTVEYLASAYVDLKLHLAGDADIDPAAFEKSTLDGLGMPDEIVMRHRTPQFGHVFSGDGYASGYYSYLWADTLTADAAEAFHEAGSMYDDEVAARLVAHILSVGNTVDPAASWRAFRGRDVDVSALLRDRGFPVE